MSQKAKSAQQAVALVGVTECRLYLLTKAVERALRSQESKMIDLRSFWTNSLERALFARHIARLLKTDTEVAFAGAMLQDFLLPSLTNDLFHTYRKFTENRDDNPDDLHQFEQKAQRWDHAEAAAQLMFGWGFPDELICCVLLHHRGMKLLNNKQLGRTPVAAVAVSALMPDAFRQVGNGMEQLIALESKWAAFDLLKAAKQVDREFQELSPASDNPFSFLRCCRIATSVV